MEQKNGWMAWVNMVMECARKECESAEGWVAYVKRKAVVRGLRAECEQLKREANDRKSMQERVWAENLSGEIGLYGGLWKNAV